MANKQIGTIVSNWFESKVKIRADMQGTINRCHVRNKEKMEQRGGKKGREKKKKWINDVLILLSLRYFNIDC